MKKGKSMKKFFKALANIFALLIGADCEWRREAIDNGIIDHSGQGRDKYGK